MITFNVGLSLPITTTFDPVRIQKVDELGGYKFVAAMFKWRDGSGNENGLHLVTFTTNPLF
jgi:hypothetical protein